MTFSVLFVVLGATLFIAVNAAKVPEEWKTCPRSLSGEEFTPCIKGAISSALTELFSKGAPFLNIPPLSPLNIPMLGIGKGMGPVAVEMKFMDMEVANLDSFEIVVVRFDNVENYTFGSDVVLKQPLLITAKYDMNGKVLLLPITGNGDCELKFGLSAGVAIDFRIFKRKYVFDTTKDNLRASLDLTGSPISKNGETYMDVTQLILSFDTDKLHTRFDNLFGGNKELSDNMNNFVNENWDVILKELKPAIVEALGLAFRNIANHIFNSIPYNQIFPA